MMSGLLAHLFSIGGSVYQVQWPSPFSTPVALTDFEVRFEKEGFEYKGRGFSLKSAEQALVKALVECFERKVCRENALLNSNGVASHFSAVEAKKNSEAEYLERVCFLLHFYTASAFGEVLGQDPLGHQLYQFPGVLQFCSRLIGYGSSRANRYAIVASLARLQLPGRCDGFVVGLGASESLSLALEKANQELFQLVGYFTFSNQKTLNLRQFQMQQELSFADHAWLALDASYSKKVQTYIDSFLSSKNQRPINLHLDLESTRLPCEKSLSATGFLTFRTGALDGLDLFTGFPNPKFTERLMKLAARQGLNPKGEWLCLPHPLA
jgi:hypothetical protein